MKIVIYAMEHGDLRLSDASVDRIRQAARALHADVVFAADHATAVREIRDADILFGYITPEMLRRAAQLKWVQAPMSSLGTPRGDYYLFPELIERPIVLTNMSGIYSDVIPTHVFAFITAFARDFPTLLRHQLQATWTRDANPINLHGTTLGIIGLGGIGKGVARIGAAFGMRVLAVEPMPHDVPSVVERVWPPEALTEVLQASDFVVLCLPDAPGTVNLIGAAELQAMKRTAYLINIGRGRTVDLAALTHALAQGLIAGAGLDVFPPGLEPLPPAHPLWAMPNVIITPHTAGAPTPPERRVTVFLENLERFLTGKPLLNLVDKRTMVRVGPGYDVLP